MVLPALLFNKQFMQSYIGFMTQQITSTRRFW